MFEQMYSALRIEILGPGAPPATLAPEVMTSILRDDLGFDGFAQFRRASAEAVA